MDTSKALLVKSSRELLTITAYLSHNNKRKSHIQEEEIGRRINLPYVEDTSKKLRRMLKSHKIRSTFYTKSTLRKCFLKPKDRVVTEDKNRIVYEIDRSNCEAVYFLVSLNGL